MNRIAIICAVFSLVGSAFAQNKAPSSAPSKKAPEVKKINIEEGETAIGEPARPLEGYVTGVSSKKRGSLIKVRENFTVEVIKSVNEL